MRQTTDEQLEQIWAKALEDDIVPNAWRAVTQWGDTITIFSGWDDVEAMAEIVYQVLPQEFIDDTAPAWLHLSEDRRPNVKHHIEWAIGEYFFEDSYTPCSNCGVAIHIHDYQPQFYVDHDSCEITCADCLRTDLGWAFDYLAYCSRHMSGDNQEIARNFVEPSDHGFILLNPYSGYGEYGYSDCLIKYDGIANFPLEDHEDLPYEIGYADYNQLARLAKSNRLIDDGIMLLAQYHRSGYLFWAKFDEDKSEDASINLAILQYGISRIFAKYVQLRSEGK